MSSSESATDRIFLNDIPSPFNLLRPKRWWVKVLADWDPDLRIFPSQKKPVYRVMRLARLSGGLNYDRMRPILKTLHPDTQIALERHLLPVMTFGPDVFNRHPSIIVNTLRRRDTWQFSKPGDTPEQVGERAADALDNWEAQTEEAERKERRQENRARLRAMGIAYRYRTGARVSLVQPRRGGTPVPDAINGRSQTTPST